MVRGTMTMGTKSMATIMGMAATIMVTTTIMPR
jgi:hypothetical protein